jgi:hypothetical protein
MKFLSLKFFEPKVGSKIDFEIYVQSSEKKVLLLFNSETVFSEDEVARAKKYLEQKALFVREDQYMLIAKKSSDALSQAVSDGGTFDSEAGTQVTKVFFRSDELLSGQNGDQKLKTMVNMANNFVTDLLKTSKDERSSSLVEVLKGVANSDNEFVNHANQVAAISTMVGLMIENMNVENVIEINLGAILHGMGLAVMVKQPNAFFSQYANFQSFTPLAGSTNPDVLRKVIDKHFDGHNKFTSADNVVFLQHLALIETNIDKVKLDNIKSNSMSRTIADFRTILSAANEEGVRKANPYLSAKVLAVGDRLVSLMNYYKKNPTFVATAVRDLVELNSKTEIFDPKIIEKVSQMG